MRLIKFIRMLANGQCPSGYPSGSIYINPSAVSSVSRYEQNTELSYVTLVDGNKYLVRGDVDNVAKRLIGAEIEI